MGPCLAEAQARARGRRTPCEGEMAAIKDVVYLGRGHLLTCSLFLHSSLLLSDGCSSSAVT